MLAALQKIESISEQEEEDIISEQNEEESSHYCTNQNKFDGKIIVADDQMINLEVLKDYT